LAYADDIVLLAPSPSAMRVLQICDSYATEYDINFNPDNAKLLVIPAHKWRYLYSAMCNYTFYVDNKKVGVILLRHLLLMVTILFKDVTLLLDKPTLFCASLMN